MLGPPVQIAHVVPDARRAAREMAALHGAGPFVVIDDIRLAWAEIDGRPGDFVHTSAYGWWGEVMLELVQPDSPAPSPFLPPVWDGGGVHHLAVMVSDLSATSRWCQDHGIGVTARAMTRSEHGPGTEFAFVDTRPTLGHFTEIYERSDRLVAFYDHVRGLSVDWDGSDPVR